MKNRSVLFGLEGTGIDYLRKLIELGHLPNFKKILDNGVSGGLNSVLPGPNSFSAWTSCFTGMNPGKHGISDSIIYESTVKGFKFVSSTDITQKRLWNYLSEKGKVVGVFDFLCVGDNNVYPDNLENSKSANFESWKKFLSNNDWDFFAGCFGELSYDIEKYKSVDRFVGELMSLYPDANFMFVSGYGTSLNKHNLYINNILEKYSYFVKSKVNSGESFIDKIRKVITKFVPKITASTVLDFGMDLNNTLAYSISTAGIYINRDCEKIKSGSIKISEAVDKIISDLESDDFLKGKIVKIYRKEDLFKGSYLEKMPDIIPIYNSDYKSSEKTPMGVMLDNLVGNKGSSNMEGLFLAYGPNFKSNVQLEGLNIKDIAPTLLNMFNIDIPANIDGNCLTEVFIKSNEIKFSPISTETKHYSGDMSAEEEEEVKETLRQMGYL